MGRLSGGSETWTRGKRTGDVPPKDPTKERKVRYVGGLTSVSEGTKVVGGGVGSEFLRLGRREMQVFPV